MLIRIIFSLLCGFIIALFVCVHNDQWASEYAARLFQKVFERAYECKIVYRQPHLSFCPFKLTFADLHVMPTIGNAWKWRAQQFSLGASFNAFLRDAKIYLNIDLNDLDVYTRLKGMQPAIVPHARKLLGQGKTGLPVGIGELRCARSRGIIHDDVRDYKLDIDFCIGLKKETIPVRATISLDGIQLKKGATLLGQGTATLYAGAQIGSFDIIGQWYWFQTDTRYVYNAHWYQGLLTGTIADMDRTLCIDDITVKTDVPLYASASIKSPVEHIVKATGIPFVSAADWKGTMEVEASLESDAVVLDAHMAEVTYKGYTLLNQLNAHAEFEKNQWSFQLKAQHPLVTLAADGIYNVEHNHATIQLYNEMPIQLKTLSSLTVAPRDLNIEITGNGKQMQGKYAIKGYAQERSHSLMGNYYYTPYHMRIKGTYDNDQYLFQLKKEKQFIVDQIWYGTPKGELLSIKSLSTHPDRWQGAINLERVHDRLPHAWQHLCQLQGKLLLHGYIDRHCYGWKCSSSGVTIHVPGWYNCIRNVTAVGHCYPHNQFLKIKNITLECARGKASIYDAQWLWGNKGYISCPIVLNNCAFNVGESVFGGMSGALNVYRPTGSITRIRGVLLSEYVQLRENLFAGAFETHMVQPTSNLCAQAASEVEADISLYTKHPIQVQTPYLNARSHGFAHISHRMNNPSIEGSVRVIEGEIIFPYDSLLIDKAEIQFNPASLNDPLINLHASKAIRGFEIHMNVTGSKKNPLVRLYSYPPLTEDQIIALLCTGSPQESLGALVPTLVAHTITRILFDTVDTAPSINRYIKTLFGPLRHFHLVPSVAERAGKTDVRGALEIDINEQWHARIQKSFNSTEDTRGELEYRFSDDLNVRLFKDEQRNVGAQIEACWRS